MAAAEEPIHNKHLMWDPLINKGSAFTPEERRHFGLEGLLPAGISTQEQQATRAYASVAAAATPLAKYRELTALQDRNEYLYYRVLMDHLEELMPIVYTPTVGEATQKFSDVFQRGRGIWITPDHRGRIKDVLERALEDRCVELMVVTDNESILGIGDQGAGGMAISIGKLALYTACAGIRPEATLPISLDVGTNNESLLAHPNYLGWPHRRITGEPYYALVEEFVCAIETLYPKALVQWEDFRKDNALTILDTYHKRILSFNDDIQGTGAVTLAGIFSALRAKGESVIDQRFLIYGAGAAGLGIARQIKAALTSAGVAAQDLETHIGLLDSRGILVADEPHRDAYKNDLAWSVEFANRIGLRERDLQGSVRAFKPTVLIGTSGNAGAFDESIIELIQKHCGRPVILPLSNPTANAEATPEDLLRWTDGKALIATGSPFAPVTYNGVTYHVGQGNNVFIFPALGLAALAANASEITDNMITRTAESLAAQVSDEELARGQLYPNIDRLRQVTHAVATDCLDQAFKDSVAQIQRPENMSQEIDRAMWHPIYSHDFANHST